MSTEQKVIITNNDEAINTEINRGWIVKSVIAQHVAVSTGSPLLGKLEGKFCFILEREQ